MLFRKKIIIGLYSSKNFLQIVCFYYVQKKYTFICAETSPLSKPQISEDVKRLFKKADVVCASFPIEKEIVQFLNIEKKKLKSFLNQNLSSIIPFEPQQVVSRYDKREDASPLYLVLKKNLHNFISKLSDLKIPAQLIYSPSRALEQFLLSTFELQQANCFYIEENAAAFLRLHNSKKEFFQSFSFENIFEFEQKIKSLLDEVKILDWHIVGPESKNEALLQILTALKISPCKAKAKEFSEMEFLNQFVLAIGTVQEFFRKKKAVSFSHKEFTSRFLGKKFRKSIFKFSFSMGLCLLCALGFVNATLMRFEKQILKGIELSLADHHLSDSRLRSSFWTNKNLKVEIDELKKLEKRITSPKFELMPSPLHIFGLLSSKGKIKSFDFKREGNKILFSIGGMQDEKLYWKHLCKNFKNVRYAKVQSEEQILGEIWLEND